MTPRVIVGNWKMHKTPSETEALLSELIPHLREAARASDAPVEVVVAPSFVCLPLAARMLSGAGIGLAAQDCHWSEEGPFTGEVSARMLAELGCRCVILGHSERREHFGETDQRVNLKARMALFWGLTPILCVGEHADERASGHTAQVVEAQLKRCLASLTLDDGQRLMVAYEPVWAIGSGRTPAPSEIDEVHRLIRAELTLTFGPDRGAALPILYGGSVGPGTVGPILQAESVSGFLIGAASLEASTFLEVVERVRGLC